jgi:dihydrofolate reductase
MRKLVAAEFMTLDGVMQAPGSPDEDRSGGFEQGGWQLSYFDDVFGRAIMEGLAETGGFLLGRRTYEIFAAHWPNQPDEDPLAGTFNELPKHVVSTTLTEPLPWVNSVLIRSDVPRAVAALKDGTGKDIQIIGSGELGDHRDRRPDRDLRARDVIRTAATPAAAAAVVRPAAGRQPGAGVASSASTCATSSSGVNGFSRKSSRDGSSSAIAASL